MTSSQKRRLAEMIGRGYKQADVAERLGVSVRTVRRALREPAVASVAQEVRANVDPSAAEVLRALLSSDREDIRLRAAVALITKPPPPEAEAGGGTVRVHVIPGKVSP